MKGHIEKAAVLFSVCAFCATASLASIFSSADPANAASPGLYMVSADIAATTEKPGFRYEKGDGFIEYAEGLKEALLYGNIVETVPLTDSEFAGRWGAVSLYGDEGDDEIDKDLGFVDLTALAPLPEVDFFPRAEPIRFMTDSP
jgi:hypothetical protein